MRESLRALAKHPFKGRPGQREDTREFTLKFGRSSYLVRYQVTDDAAIIARIWQGKEKR